MVNPRWESTHCGSQPTAGVNPWWELTHVGNQPMVGVNPRWGSAHGGSQPTVEVNPPWGSTHGGSQPTIYLWIQQRCPSISISQVTSDQLRNQFLPRSFNRRLSITLSSEHHLGVNPSTRGWWAVRMVCVVRLAPPRHTPGDGCHQSLTTTTTEA